jgi:multicomponent Na+:H+ antiporter subunit D
VVTFYARLSVAKEIPADRIRFFYALWLLFITGLLGMTITGDVFNIYVLMEISSLASYALVAMGKYHNRKALSASINYLVLGTIGASFFLLGIGYLYSVTGTLNMADLTEKVKNLHDNRTVITAFAFLLIGLGVKMALFPLHGWLPNAHGYAPPIVSALLSAVAIKVGAYVMIRFLFSILGVQFSFEKLPTGPILLVLGSLAILIGSYFAIQQFSLKRMLAYSSVAQIGYIALGFGLANESGLMGSLIHIFNHALMKSGLFLVAGIVIYRAGEADIDHLQGLGRKMPFTMAAFTAGGLGLIGTPLTSGFISKWYLVTGAIDRGLTILAVVVLAGSLLAVVYVWRWVEVVYFKVASDSIGDVKEAPWSLVVPAWILIGASVYFGIDASLSSDMAGQAVHALLGTE